MHDLAVIGAGPAGATLARLVGERYRVLLVDKRSLPADPSHIPAGKCCGGLLAPDAQRGQESINRQLPPRGRECRQSREYRVDQNREDERLRASKTIGQHPEQHAAHGPAHQKDGEDDPSVPPDGFRSHCPAGLTLQQFVQRGMQHHRVNRGVHGVKHPAQPRDEQHQPLVACDTVTPGGPLHGRILSCRDSKGSSQC